MMDLSMKLELECDICGAYEYDIRTLSPEKEPVTDINAYVKDTMEKYGFVKKDGMLLCGECASGRLHAN